MLGVTYMIISFFVLSPFYILPLGAGMLYIMALYDKYLMLRCTKLFKFKSFEYGMNLLKPFSWDLTSFLAYHYQKNTEKLVEEHESHPDYADYERTYWLVQRIFYMVVGFFILSFFVLRVNLKDGVRKRFKKENAHMKYDEVCHLFAHAYRKEYPFAEQAL